jgi:hypothetical protein
LYAALFSLAQLIALLLVFYFSLLWFVDSVNEKVRYVELNLKSRALNLSCETLTLKPYPTIMHCSCNRLLNVETNNISDSDAYSLFLVCLSNL